MSENRWRLGARFELFGQLGTGVAGTVWRAVDLRDGGEHAVRLLRPELVSDPQAVTELYSALNAVAQIGHPGIVAADDAATGEGWLALRSRLVAGESLRALLARQGALDPARAAHVMAQVCDALAAAHAAGIAHADLHPGNVLVTTGAGAFPEAVVTDFGLATLVQRDRAAHGGQVLVPPLAYRAPEAVTSASAANAAASADVYAAGVLLYECLTGQPRPTPVPGLPDQLWSIIVSCLSGDPRYRPPAGQLAAALRVFAGTAPQHTDAAMTTRLPSVAAEAMTTRLAAVGAGNSYGGDNSYGGTNFGSGSGGYGGGVRLPRLITEHKTESGIAAAVVVVSLLIGGALMLGGAGASASTASSSPSAKPAPATTAADTPEAVVLPVGSASPSPSPSASPSATAPVQVALVNAHSNTCLDTAGRIFANGTTEDIWTCNGTPAQVWTLTPDGQLTEDGGSYCLDDYGLEKTPGTRVVLWSCNGGANQRWMIQSNGSIVSANAGLCIDVSGKGTSDGTPLVLWPCDGSQSQQWSGR